MIFNVMHLGNEWNLERLDPDILVNALDLKHMPYYLYAHQITNYMIARLLIMEYTLTKIYENTLLQKYMQIHSHNKTLTHIDTFKKYLKITFTSGDEDETARLAEVLETQLNDLNKNTTFQALSTEVQAYDGGSPSKYRTWREEIERFAATIRNVDADDYRYICRKTLTGPAGREYRRYIEQNDTATWQEIKAHLGEKYDDPDRSRSSIYSKDPMSWCRGLQNTYKH